MGEEIMSDPWKELADRYGGSKPVETPKDEWSALTEKYTAAPSNAAMPTRPSSPLIKIGKDAFADTLKAELQNADWLSRNLAGFGTAASNLFEGAKQLVGKENRGQIEANKIMRAEAPVGAFLGDASMLALPMGLAGNSVKAAGGIGAGYGFMNPTDASGMAEMLQGKLANAAIGGVTGAAGQWGANKLLSSSGNKVAAIEQKIQDKAAQVAASETASARSAAGNAAQNAYRQLEHIRELGTNRALTAQEQLVKESLERELAEKSLENLMPAASLKQSTSEAYKEAMKTEGDRAAKYAADKLSGAEVKQQVMARLKRYGPAALGGVAGNFLFPGLGGAVGGAATGLVLRPALRSMVNLSKNPAVQYGLLSPIANSATLRSPLVPATSVAFSEGLLSN